MKTMSAMNLLKDIHRDETAFIVGKGPSLRFLRADHFQAEGPVITINEAILPVQELGLANPLYSLQKDGDPAKMVKPNEDVCLILQYPGFSETYFPEHPWRLLVDPVSDLGLKSPIVMSIRICIAVAKIMGCGRIALVCCDSMTNGDMKIYDPREGQELASGAAGHYAAVIPLVRKDLATLPHEFIQPKEEEHV